VVSSPVSLRPNHSVSRIDATTATRPRPPASTASSSSRLPVRAPSAASGGAARISTSSTPAWNFLDTVCQVLMFTGIGARLPMLPAIRFSSTMNCRCARES
jgi:hypothetical protein